MDLVLKKNASPVMVILAFATVYIVWGSTFFFIQKALVGFPPMLLGGIRFFVAGIIMLGYTRLRGEKIFVLRDFKHAAVSGLLMLFAGTGAVIWVEQYLPSAMVAIMVSSGPLWFILLDKAKWPENFSSKATMGGLILGFAGIVLLFSENIAGAFSTTGNYQKLGGVAILIIGSIAWSGGSLYSKYKSTTGSVSVNIAWQMIIAGLAFIPGSLLLGEMQNLQWHTISSTAWLSLLFLIFFGSIAAFGAYVWLLQVRPAAQVSTHAYVNPVVAVLLGIAFANEHISMLQVLGLVTILGSVLIISLVKFRNDRMKAQKESIFAKRRLLQMPVKLYRQIIHQPMQDVEM